MTVTQIECFEAELKHSVSPKPREVFMFPSLRSARASPISKKKSDINCLKGKTMSCL